eukprot:CAMPEP_0201117110 /NCGR_PEP_ID=MMETSP0850-20130426/1185_1 /ASSEMBLY_ACC=CAM_ASM_000622 /TAXON_ID=183588 /ORGANISM="Pseudo-nitzschia fraudulenta, Strain WWA7" /LENGTH=162 /DNA_ID=CAMNT_0047381351 /DNA_START=650 /DNA_END=1138 /DNA_ORIENTATION=+
MECYLQNQTEVANTAKARETANCLGSISIEISLAHQVPHDDSSENGTLEMIDKEFNKSELHSLQDFTERLTLRFNNEIQTEHFGGTCTVSLEGVAVKFFSRGSTSPVMELFTFLSDSKVQDSSVVNYNMVKHEVLGKVRMEEFSDTNQQEESRILGSLEDFN